MKRRNQDERLIMLKELMSDPITRNEAYNIAAEIFHTSVAAMKMTASRGGLRVNDHSLQYALSIKDEEGLAAVCRKHARRGTPLSIPEIVELVSRYKGFPDDKRVSRHFVYDFLERHKKELFSNTPKITSPSRSSDVMDKVTEEFIATLSPLFERKTINEKNLFVCDETMIGDPESKQVRVGERRESGGGNINLFEKRGKVLGCFLPFSKCDGTTPFRVFVSKGESQTESTDSEAQSKPVVKVTGTPELQRLYATSESGYITIPLFKCILDHLSKWWNQCNPSLTCFIICDRLPVHVNKDVQAFAMERNIKIFPIMPGSSHWFQVHDQLPFGDLKKKLLSKKSRFSGLPSIPSDKSQAFMRGLFTIVESNALASNIVLESFKQVGLWPWNPALIRQLCQVHCPPPSHLNSTIEEEKLDQMMSDIRAERDTERREIIALGELMSVDSFPEEPKYAFREAIQPRSPTSDKEWRQLTREWLTKRREMQRRMRHHRKTKSSGKRH